MIAACEKNKFVYVLNRDNAANLTISSPLEAHKARHVVFAVCGVDCGFENPVFAAIELNYEDADQVEHSSCPFQNVCLPDVRFCTFRIQQANRHGRRRSTLRSMNSTWDSIMLFANPQSLLTMVRICWSRFPAGRMDREAFWSARRISFFTGWIAFLTLTAAASVQEYGNGRRSENDHPKEVRSDSGTWSPHCGSHDASAQEHVLLSPSSLVCISVLQPLTHSVTIE